jgi:hypothetical protein
MKFEIRRKGLQHAAGANLVLAVMLLMGMGIIFNVLQFNEFEEHVRYKALVPYVTADITKIAEARSSRLRARYRIFFELGRRYPGSTIILPKAGGPGSDFEASLLSYGRAKNLVHVDYRADKVQPGFDLTVLTVAEGKSGPSGLPFVIAAGFSPNCFVLLQQEKTILLDLSLLMSERSHD